MTMIPLAHDPSAADVKCPACGALPGAQCSDEDGTEYAMLIHPERADTVPTPAIDAFHGHLDVCRRCEKQPFNLCPKGAKLLQATPEDVAAVLGAGLPSDVQAALNDGDPIAEQWAERHADDTSGGR